MQPSVAATEAQPKPQSLLDSIAEDMARKQADIGSRYMPTLTPKQFTEREQLIKELREMLVEGADYGVIPGTEKPTLLLPGAQKVCAYFGYVPRYSFDVAIEDWTGQQYGEPLFYYRIQCDLEKDGKRVGSGLGSCNSWETKYRYRWMTNPPAVLDKSTLVTRDASLYEPAFAIKAKETGGKYGKPLAYWERWEAAIANGEAIKDESRKTKDGRAMIGYRMGGLEYRVPNENFPDTINTVLKIGKKRAYIDSTLSATGLSQYFTQDLEDMDTSVIDTGGHPVGTEAAAQHVAERKIEDSTPKELKPYLDLLPQKGGPKIVFSWIENELNAAGGMDGQKFYREQTENAKRHGELTVGVCRGIMLVLFTELERLRRLKADAEQQQRAEAAQQTIGAGITDDDVPF